MYLILKLHNFVKKIHIFCICFEDNTLDCLLKQRCSLNLIPVLYVWKNSKEQCMGSEANDWQPQLKRKPLFCCGFLHWLYSL